MLLSNTKGKSAFAEDSLFRVAGHLPPRRVERRIAAVSPCALQTLPWQVPKPDVYSRKTFTLPVDRRTAFWEELTMNHPSPDEARTDGDFHFLAGEIFDGRYELVRELGRGGMGVVWLAKHLERSRVLVVLKFLEPEWSLDPRALPELERELETLFALKHHHIVRAYRLARAAQRAAIEMDYIEGGDLHDYRATQPGKCLDPAVLAPWVGQACAALQYALDTAKLMHLDLKPMNLLLNGKAELVLSDFGLSEPMAETLSQMRTVRPKERPGTSKYMSPQRSSGARPTPADDVYSLGVTLYELLTGAPPFGGSQTRSHKPTPVSTRRREITTRDGLELAPVPQHWDEVIANCLSERPEVRPDLPTIAMAFAVLVPPKPKPDTPPAQIAPRPVRKQRPLVTGEISTNVSVGHNVYGDVIVENYLRKQEQEDED